MVFVCFFIFFVHPTSIFLEQLLKYYYKRITKSIFPVIVPAQFVYRAWLIACVYLQSLHLCYGNSFYSGFLQSLYANMELICQIWPFLRFQMVQNGKYSWQNMIGGVWLENGWCEFASCHGLTMGHLLVFRYDENSQFDVLIFDATATEIDYPLDDQLQGRRMEDNQSDDDSLEIMDGFTRGEGSSLNLTLL